LGGQAIQVTVRLAVGEDEVIDELLEEPPHPQEAGKMNNIAAASEIFG
jgi:hypothetical protein